MDWVSLACMGSNFFQDKTTNNFIKKDYKGNKPVDHSDIPLLRESGSSLDKEVDEEEYFWGSSKTSPKKTSAKSPTLDWGNDEWGQGDWEPATTEENVAIISSSKTKSKTKRTSSSHQSSSSKVKTKDSDLLIDFEENGNADPNNSSNWDVDWDDDDDAWGQLGSQRTLCSTKND